MGGREGKKERKQTFSSLSVNGTMQGEHNLQPISESEMRSSVFDCFRPEMTHKGDANKTTLEIREYTLKTIKSIGLYLQRSRAVMVALLPCQVNASFLQIPS